MERNTLHEAGDMPEEIQENFCDFVSKIVGNGENHFGFSSEEAIWG